MTTLDDYLYPEDPERFESISYNKQDPNELPEFARGKVLNRYGDILPNPRTIVKLTREQNDPESIYVNANYITDFFGRNGWIAAQGPTQRTLPAFVRMIWEQDVKTIVMLTKLKEGTKGKCEPYFPAKLNGTIRFESIEVTLRKSERKDGYVENQLVLGRGGQQRVVTQFWYTSWPDHGVPTDGNNNIYTREMILLVLTVRAHRKKIDNMASPAIVHCSAGVGRTGAFIAIDQAIDAYKQRVKVDINDVVVNMRQCRMALIQHTTQYSFVWAAARDYICGKLELKAAKGRTQPAAPTAGGGQSPDRLHNAKIGDLFRVIENFDNPDGNEGVLLVRAGDIVELVETSDLWWWMRREYEEGWVLPDVIEPIQPASGKPAPPDPALKPRLVTDDGEQVPNGSKPAISQKPTVPGNKPALAAKPNVNPFAAGDGPVDRTASANNPFETGPVPKERVQSNPFEPAEAKNNPFGVVASSGPSKSPNPFADNSTNGSEPPLPTSAEPQSGDAMASAFESDMALIDAKMAKLKSTSSLPKPEDEEQEDEALPEMPSDVADSESVDADDDDDLGAQMENDFASLSSKIDSLKDAEAASGDVEVDYPPHESQSPREEQGRFFSTLQPFTYVTEDGVVGTLFKANELLTTYIAPADLPQEFIRTPEQIVGPAVVSHDNSWRLINNAAVYANARLAGPTTVEDHSDTEC